DSLSAENLLVQMSKFNDRVQAAIFNPNTLAPTFKDSDIRRPFPFNAFYTLDEAPEIDGNAWRLEVSGLVSNKKSWTLAELNALPQVNQITRHICVEGWSAIGSWSGTPLPDFLKLIGADTNAKFVWFKCAEDYTTSIDMQTAMHPQTQMTLKFDGQTLPRAYGYPMKVRVPTRLGFKNPKYVTAMEVTNDYKGGYWEDQGYNDYSGL
ncbi:MAG: Twin-arginine translocation pathway signal, partial [Tardiphaga sp.]|nr:Twin-arginine translocation pathway signal [Tardiphaga sp.]